MVKMTLTYFNLGSVYPLYGQTRDNKLVLVGYNDC